MVSIKRKMRKEYFQKLNNIYEKVMREDYKRVDPKRVLADVKWDIEHGKNPVDALEGRLIKHKVDDRDKDFFRNYVTNRISLNENITPGKYQTKGGETITVHSVKGNTATISGNDSKNKDMDLDALHNIIQE